MPGLDKEANLVERLQARSEEAMNDFCQQYGPFMYAAIKRVTSDMEAAEDVLQHSYIKCWENIGSYSLERNGRLHIWASNIAINLATEWLQHQQVEK